jgi:protein involved in polysaccharide export with SLBB domain
MLSTSVRRLLLSCLVIPLTAVSGRAQTLPSTLPSPAQAQQMLRSDPNLIVRLQQMMQQSGLTPDQVRSRLRAQGYPDSLLDQYLGGSTIPDSLAPSPDEETFAALRSLGVGDTLVIDSLRKTIKVRERTFARLDSAFADSVTKALKNDTLQKAIRKLISDTLYTRKLADSGFKVFGRELFMSEGGAFDANNANGADPNYRFGPSDQLVLFLTGDVEESYRLTVTREGFVVIPKVGQINVAGLTRSQLEDQLYDRLGRVYSGVRRGGGTTRFYIDVSQIGANQIFVTGDVEQPSSYRVSRAATALTALYRAGGPTVNGSMRNVQVKRAGQIVATIDFYDYALRGDASKDVRLESGDIVFVAPRGPQVRVAGKVVRSATYELLPGETLADVIRMAGGFSDLADRRRVQIDRVVPPNERSTAGADRHVIDVPSDLFATAPVQGGDVVKVFEIASRVSNVVTVTGNVWTPGQVGFRRGMRLSDALHSVGGLKPDSYLGRVLVTRLRPSDSTRVMLNTALFDTTGRAVDDFELQDQDEIAVFATTDFRPERFITVNGAVKKPGPIPFFEGMTMRDAVILSGGITEGALLTEAEIARLPENRAAGVTAVTYKVPLDSSYLFERGPDGRYVGPPGITVPSGQTPDVPLDPYDAILIKRQPDWQLQQTVAIEGEVKYPGAYTLISKTEKLSALINRAGGLTSAAYPEGIVFIRRKNSIGRVGVELPRVLKNPGDIDNLQLADGDSIFIPKFTPVVTLRGAVNSQVGVTYVAGANLDYYIRSAGGPTLKGDRKHAYVTQPNGKVETRERYFLNLIPRTPHPQPGSTVFVPERDPNDKRDWLQVATAFSSILGSLVAVAAIVTR